MTAKPPSSSAPTREARYTARLLREVWWKRLLDVQRPYRWNLRRLRLGFVLDVGCGVGRNLLNLGPETGVGVDHNVASVAACLRRGLTVFTPEAFHRSREYARPGRFDALLVAHVVEHLSFREAENLLREYLPYLRSGGRVVLIAPQEAGFRSDATHVEFFDFAALERLARAVGLEPVATRSFPFPRPLGRLFTHNEFMLVARKP